jgi:hypothetical protein
MEIMIDAPVLKEVKFSCREIKNLFLRTPSLIKENISIRNNIWLPCKKNLVSLLDYLTH